MPSGYQQLTVLQLYLLRQTEIIDYRLTDFSRKRVLQLNLGPNLFELQTYPSLALGASLVSNVG